MITDFPLNPLANLSGLQSFIFSPYQNISSIPPAGSGKITSPVIFNGGFDFFKGYSTIDQLSFLETLAQDDNLGAYTWAITGYTPGDSDILINLMEDMKRCRHLVVVRDHTGNLRLVGKNAPLYFSADFNSGKQAGTDAKGYSFSFSGQSKYRAPLYML